MAVTVNPSFGGVDLAQLGVELGKTYWYSVEVRLVSGSWDDIASCVSHRDSAGWAVQGGQTFGAFNFNPPPVGEWVRLQGSFYLSDPAAAFLNFGYTVKSWSSGSVWECRRPMLSDTQLSEYVPPGAGDDFVVLGKFGGNRGGYPASSGGRSTGGSVVAPDANAAGANIFPAGYEGVLTNDPLNIAPGGAWNGGPNNNSAHTVDQSGTVPGQGWAGGYFPWPDYNNGPVL